MLEASGLFYKEVESQDSRGEMALSPHSVHSGDQATLPVSAVPSSRTPHLPVTATHSAQYKLDTDIGPGQHDDEECRLPSQSLETILSLWKKKNIPLCP